MKKLFYSTVMVIAIIYFACWLIDGSPPNAEKCAAFLIPLLDMVLTVVRPVWEAFWSFLTEVFHYVFLTF